MRYMKSLLTRRFSPPLIKGGQGGFTPQKSPARLARRPLLLNGAKGFTLVELVVVIVLLGITAVTFTTLITGSVRGYLDTANRQDSAAIARIALDRIARDLREAMPQSVRVTNDHSCLQFLPVVASTVYTAFAADFTSVTVMDFAAPNGGGYYAAVYPINSDELYGTTAMKPISDFGTMSNNLRTITLASGFPAPRNSPGERLYVVSGSPVSYCFTNAQLIRYTSAISTTQPTPGAGLNNGAMLIDKLIAPTTFTYGLGNWQNNALVTIALTLQQAGSNNEKLQFDHEVWLRNVQ